MMPAVLLLVYNRPDHTSKVLKRLADLGVSEIHISADGPKDAEDMARCTAVRTACMNSGMSVISNFSDVHLGCKEGVISGIAWFFKLVHEGIILEDDCLPTESFLRFSSVLLEEYRSESNVYMISGNNPMGKWESSHSHHFVRIGHIWGWATWRDRWQEFDPKLPALTAFENDHGFTRLFGNTSIPKQIRKKTHAALAGTLDTWDYQWTLHHAIQGRLAAIPCENLIENVGFGQEATHTVERPCWLSDHVGVISDLTLNSPIRPDREYEMGLFMSQKLNGLPLSSSHAYCKKGRSMHIPLRIVQINSTDFGGGAESLVMQHHQLLRHLGHDAMVVVGQKQTDDVSVVRLSSDPIAQIIDLNPDIIHLHNLHDTGLTLNELTKLTDHFKLIWTLHDSWTVCGSERHPFELNPAHLSYLDREEWNRNLAARGDALRISNIRITAPSQWLRDQVLIQHGLPSHYVSNSVKDSPMRLASKQRGAYLLFVANHADRNPYRELDILKQAWIKANSSLGSLSTDLICIGGTAHTDRYGSNELIMMERQNAETIKQYMHGAIAVVQASTQDNAPLTILEAHSSGTPVIGSMVGGIPEMVSPSEASVLYAAGNLDSLTESILKAVRAQAELKEEVIAQEGHISSETMAYTFLGHYYDMLHG
jgi:glycosyltransferase involved in cell wall biosynthesis